MTQKIFELLEAIRKRSIGDYGFLQDYYYAKEFFESAGDDFSLEGKWLYIFRSNRWEYKWLDEFKPDLVLKLEDPDYYDDIWLYKLD